MFTINFWVLAVTSMSFLWSIIWFMLSGVNIIMRGFETGQFPSIREILFHLVLPFILGVITLGILLGYAGGLS